MFCWCEWGVSNQFPYKLGANVYRMSFPLRVVDRLQVFQGHVSPRTGIYLGNSVMQPTCTNYLG